MTQAPATPAEALRALPHLPHLPDLPDLPVPPGLPGEPAPAPAEHRGTTGATASPGRLGSRLPWAVALGAYTVLVAVVVGWPTPVDAGARAPLSSLFADLYGVGVPSWFDYAVLEVSANVAMFVPFGVLITVLDRRRWWCGVLVPGLVSGTAETLQHLLLPERFATWVDVAANTGGAALGVALALVLLARRGPARRARRHRA